MPTREELNYGLRHKTEKFQGKPKLYTTLAGQFEQVTRKGKSVPAQSPFTLQVPFQKDLPSPLPSQAQSQPAVLTTGGGAAGGRVAQQLLS
jgi:hypothetical protein